MDPPYPVLRKMKKKNFRKNNMLNVFEKSFNHFFENCFQNELIYYVHKKLSCWNCIWVCFSGAFIEQLFLALFSTDQP